MFSRVLRALQRCWAWSLPWWDDTRVRHWVFRGVLDWDEGRVLWVLWTRVHHGDLWAVQGCPAEGVSRSAHRAVLDWVFFQTNLNLVWNLRLAKFHFFFPNQTGIGLENPTHFLGVSFPNQTGFGLEKDTEWNLAALHKAQCFAANVVVLFALCLSAFCYQ